MVLLLKNVFINIECSSGQKKKNVEQDTKYGKCNIKCAPLYQLPNHHDFPGKFQMGFFFFFLMNVYDRILRLSGVLQAIF